MKGNHNVCYFLVSYENIHFFNVFQSSIASNLNDKTLLNRKNRGGGYHEDN